MTKADEIKILEEIKALVFKLINARDGYMKDQLKELGNLDSIKNDFDLMAVNIKNDFMPLIGTKLNRIIHVNKERRKNLIKIIRDLRFTLRSQDVTLKDLARNIENAHTLIEDVLKETLSYRYDGVNDNETNELAEALENVLKKYDHIWVIQTKIDMGLELLPDEKEIVKNLIRR